MNHLPPDESLQHKLYMQQCLELAKRASYMGEVPVGAVIVKQGIVLATASNAQIGMCDPTAHAEVIALRDAARVQENYRLPGCTVYSTVEPCLMCAGALLHARVDKVVYGAAEPRAGAVTGSVDYFDEMAHIHKLDVVGGVLEEECRHMIQSFFRARR